MTITGNRATGRQRGAATGSGTPGHTRGSSAVYAVPRQFYKAGQ